MKRRSVPSLKQTSQLQKAAAIGSLLAVMAAFAVVWWVGLPDVPRLERAPAFAALTVEGERLQVTEQPGRPVVLNFWATWCGPCVIEMPYLEAAHRRYGDSENLLLVGINLAEDHDVVRAWLLERNITFAVVIDQFRELERAYRVGGAYPTTIFIDSGGNIVRVHRGLLTETLLAENLARIGVGDG